MPDFLLELLSEEIPARMQGKACADLARLFAEKLGEAGPYSQGIETFATPRRLALIARGLPAETVATAEEIKGPRANAPSQALEGFLRKTGLTRDQLVERDGVFFAALDKPGRATASVLAEAIPAIVRAFPWPKSMRWGAASTTTDSPRWVRPLQGLVALLGEDIVDFEIAGVASGAATVGHRFHHPGIITIGGAHDYVEKLRACRVIVDLAERQRIIAEGAAALAREAGLILVEDQGLLEENAGLTEWPVPLLGRFDPAYLDVPAEVIQLTMRTNQKYFALNSSPAFAGEGDRAERGGGAGALAPYFICVANIDASDGGAAIVAGNERVLSARLADAKFFWEQDCKTNLKEQAGKLDQIVFHEKLGTVADKVERVAKLARWLVEEGIIRPSPPAGEGQASAASQGEGTSANPSPSAAGAAFPSPARGEGLGLADQAETAARLCKADLVTGLVGEFPELQGIIGGHLARVQGLDDAIADAIRDHYKPVGQGDEVPTAPVTVAVSLADKLDTLIGFFAARQRPTGSKDPYALRRAALAVISLSVANNLRFTPYGALQSVSDLLSDDLNEHWQSWESADFFDLAADDPNFRIDGKSLFYGERKLVDAGRVAGQIDFMGLMMAGLAAAPRQLFNFLVDRLKVQQREAGVRHDLIDAVFALGGEDDLVRLLARVKALQAFVERVEGADLLAGYKRAANILKKEGWGEQVSVRVERSRDTSPQSFSTSLEANGVEKKPLSYSAEPEEASLIAALDSAEPKAQAAIEAEDFEGAMAALASLRTPVDAFFDKVTVNDPDPIKRDARLALLARMRDAVHAVADFSRIEG